MAFQNPDLLPELAGLPNSMSKAKWRFHGDQKSQISFSSTILFLSSRQSPTNDALISMSAQKRQLTKPFKVFPAPPNSILYPMGSSKEIDEYGTSPLAPAKSFCKWSRILGFPVCPVDDTEGFDFKFHWSAYLGLAFATGATAGGFLFTHTMFA